ncbi:MAG TPA: hypothetical protein VM695_04785 [Phycisphaerae bacterium]|nr:hypothetical protein [Phycisphaerae bacterium]
MSRPRDDSLSRIRALPDGPGDTPPDPAEVPAGLAGRIADEQLVHALLARELGDARQAGERGVRAVLEALAEPAARPGREGRQPVVQRVLRRTAVAAAAGLVLATGLLLLIPSERPAHAAVDRILAAFDGAADRTYRILVEPEGAPPADPPRRGRHWREKQALRRLLEEPGRGGRAELDGAILYLRGGRQFVLVRPAPNGQTVVNGHDGRQSWLVRPKRPVLVSSDPRAFRIPMPEAMAAVPFVDLRQTLLRIREGYRIAEVSWRPLPGEAATRRYVLAERKAGDREPPTSVELWADPDSGLLRRIVYHGARTRGRPQPQRISLDLVSTDGLPDDWFTHSAHHDAGVEVEPVP